MLAFCHSPKLFLCGIEAWNEGKDSMLWPCQKVSNRKDVHIEVTNSKVWEGNN